VHSYIRHNFKKRSRAARLCSIVVVGMEYPSRCSVQRVWSGCRDVALFSPSSWSCRPSFCSSFLSFFAWFPPSFSSSSARPSSSAPHSSSYPCSSSSSRPSFASLPLVVFSPSSSSPTLLLFFVEPPRRRTSSSSTFLVVDPPPRLPSSSSTLLLLPVDSAPGFGSPPPGTRCRWVRVRLPAMCCCCRSRYRPRCRCRRLRPFAGVASSGRQVVVTATVWAVDALRGLISLVVGWELGEKVMREKRATTFVVARFCDALDGPPIPWVPLVFPLPNSLVE